MRGFLAVVERDVIEHRVLLALGALLGLVALVLPYWIPHSQPITHVRLALTSALCIAATVSVAFLLGASALAPDLAEGRLGFYLARPLGPLALWGGRAASTALLTAGCVLLVGLPTMLVQGPLVFGRLGSALLWPASFWALAVAAGAGHWLSLSLRARTAWSVVDFGVALGAWYFLWSTFVRLRGEWFWYEAQDLRAVAAVALTVCFAVAGISQIAYGRTEVARSHRIHALVLVGFLPLVVCAHWLAARALAVGPDDLAGASYVEAAPSGPWLVVAGAVAEPKERTDGPAWSQLFQRFRRPVRISPRHGWPLLLWSPADGRSVPLHLSSHLITISADGGTAVWVQWNSEVDGYLLYQADLTTPNPAPLATSLRFDDRLSPRDLSLSADGERVAVLYAGDTATGATVSVYPLGGDRPLVSRTVPLAEYEHLLWFDDAGNATLLRELQRRSDPKRWLFDYKLELFQIGAEEAEPRSTDWFDKACTLSVDEEARTVFCGIHVFDLATLAPLPVLPEPPEDAVWTVRLADSHWVSCVPGDPSVLLVRREGTERAFRFPRAYFVGRPTQPAPGQAVVTLKTIRPGGDTGHEAFRTPEGRTSHETFLLDLEKGSSELLLEGYQVAGFGSSPSSLGHELFVTSEGALRQIDWSTGRWRALLPGGARETFFLRP